MTPVTHLELNSIKYSVGSSATEEFTGKRLVMAHACNRIMHDVLTQPPIGWNVGTTRAEYYVACEQAVTDRYNLENPPGFFGGIFLSFILKGVISWIVKRWLDHLFPRE